MPCRGGAHYLGEIEALCFEIHAGPQMLRDAVLLLTLAGRWSGILVDQNAKLPAGLTGLARRLEEVAVELEHIPKEVDDTVKLSSAALAQEAVELVLASHWACDPDFSPFLTLDDSPPPTRRRHTPRFGRPWTSSWASSRGQPPHSPLLLPPMTRKTRANPRTPKPRRSPAMATRPMLQVLRGERGKLARTEP